MHSTSIKQPLAGTPRVATYWGFNHQMNRGEGGGELPYKSDSDARQKIGIKLLRETNVGAV